MPGTSRRRARIRVWILVGMLCGGIADSHALTQDEISVLAGSCASCHGPGGRSPGAIPTIAGAPYRALKAQMEAFKAGEAAYATVMPRLMRGYDDAQIDALARWFAALPR